jgi:hypothetical protein
MEYMILQELGMFSVADAMYNRVQPEHDLAYYDLS